jgi:hypothetical protein
MGNIDLTKKAPQPTLTRYSSDKSAFTTGAYIQPVSYIGQNGNKIFGWMVTGFEDDTYQDGEYLDVEVSADSLAGLTPDNDEDEESPEEKMKQLLRNYGVTKLDLDEYHPTGYGYITTVYTDMVEYAHGESEEFKNLEDNTLEDLVCAVERQIEANEKAFEKSQS